MKTLYRWWLVLKVRAARALSACGVKPAKSKVLVNDCPAYLWCHCGTVFHADPIFGDNVVWSRRQQALISVCPSCGFRAP